MLRLPKRILAYESPNNTEHLSFDLLYRLHSIFRIDDDDDGVVVVLKSANYNTLPARLMDDCYLHNIDYNNCLFFY